MSVVNLYNGIFKVISNDDIMLNYLEIGGNPTNLNKVKHIQKRSKPTRIVDSLPLIAFYAPPGSVDSGNHLTYNTDIVFDVYTNDDIDVAHKIVDRIAELFVGKIPVIAGVENMQCEFVTAHESSVEQENIYCFTGVINFTISIEGYY